MQSFPEPGRKVRVTIDGGWRPRWEKGGRELAYLHVGRRELDAVPVPDGENFEPGPPYKVRDMSPDITSGASFGDDGRILLAVRLEQRPLDIRVVLDWTALLGR